MAIAGAHWGMRARGAFNVEIKLDGQWFRVNRIIQHLNVDIAMVGASAQRGFAEEYRDRLKYNIKTGGIEFGYKPHSKAYTKYKLKHGGGDALLHWSGAMGDAVKVIPLGGGRVGVGIEKDAKREKYHPKDEGILNISQYANILEHGSFGKVNIPPRPVFSDTFTKDMKGLRGLRSYMTLHIAAGLRAKGIPVIKI